MAVYVDDAKIPLGGRMKMSHMIADSAQELRQMVVDIGLQIKWIQKPYMPDEHMDVCQARRQDAIKKGAVEISQRDLAGRVLQKTRYHFRTSRPRTYRDRGLTDH